MALQYLDSIYSDMLGLRNNPLRKQKELAVLPVIVPTFKWK